jgi:hypothetical protein
MKKEALNSYLSKNGFAYRKWLLYPSSRFIITALLLLLPLLLLLLLFGIVSIKEDGTVGAVRGFVCGGGGGERCFLLLLLCPRWLI